MAGRSLQIAVIGDCTGQLVWQHHGCSGGREARADAIANGLWRVSDLLCMSNPVYASSTKARDNHDDIRTQLQEVYGRKVSAGLISRVTDAVLEELSDWQNRALQPMQPIVFLDAKRVKSRDAESHRGKTKAVYVAPGVIYSKIAQAKLYTTTTPITAADWVLPFQEEHDLTGRRIMTGQGPESCGRVDKHDFQRYPAINSNDHTKAKVQSPRTKGVCARFHKTILQKFYQITLHKTLYDSIDASQPAHSYPPRRARRIFLESSTLKLPAPSLSPEKGQSGKVSLCLQQDHPATSEARFRTALLNRDAFQKGIWGWLAGSDPFCF